ncbi:MAG TPA: MoaD/ThiS family protein, partial [Halobacteriales archaeon]|nr:MoaD/ThiS family protein [Halobacteriales archaeon]
VNGRSSDRMPDVTVIVPGLLTRFTDGQRDVPVTADTLRGAVDRLVESYPALEPHLFDGPDGLRTHVQLFHNGSGVEWDDGDVTELTDGDEVLVLQAVSGG